MFNIQLRVLYIQWLTINKTILTIKIPTLSFESVINFEIVQSGLHDIYIYIYIFLTEYHFEIGVQFFLKFQNCQFSSQFRKIASTNHT